MKPKNGLLMISAGSLALGAAACSVQEKNSTPVDSSAAVTPVPAVVPPQAPPPQPSPAPLSAKPPSPTRTGKESVKALPKPPTRIKREPPVEGGLRDSAVQPVMGIGPDGKLHPIKR